MKNFIFCAVFDYYFMSDKFAIRILFAVQNGVAVLPIDFFFEGGGVGRGGGRGLLMIYLLYYPNALMKLMKLFICWLLV